MPAMNSTPQDSSPGPEPPLLAAMALTRLELAGLELEAYLVRSIGALVLGGVALVLAIIAIAFVGIAVIALFWATHRLAASGGVALGYLLLSLAVAAHARVRWASRPAPFEATRHELQRDREAVRDLGRAIR